MSRRPKKQIEDARPYCPTGANMFKNNNLLAGITFIYEYVAIAFREYISFKRFRDMMV